MRRWLTWPKLILYLAALVSFGAWIVPRISADKYKESMRTALESALGRKVEFSTLKFQLFPLPGFTLTNLTVWEDPAIGAEPLAYVAAVHALPRFSSLLTGTLALSSVDLDDASITLTRIEPPGSPIPAKPAADSSVRWNFTSLMRPAYAANFPSVHMLSGRVNFKFGDTKSIFYLLHTDVDLWPPSSSRAPWTIRVRAQPARTDRPARGFGYFSARGQWRQSDNSVTLDVKLEQSELGDMLTLFEGRESGVLGEIHGDAHLAGPMTRVGIRGRLTVQNVHGWNEAPPGGNALPVWLSGYVDARGQTLDVRATLAQSQSPVDVRYRVSDYLGRPQWGVTALLSRMPVAPLVSIARNLGLQLPAGMEISGTADGAASYAMPQGAPRLDGQIAISNLAVTTTGSPALRLDPATLRLEGKSVALGPAVMSNAAGEVATVGIGYDMDTGKTTASISTSGMSIAGLRRQISAAGLPVLGQATAGSWSGALTWSDGWTGQIRVTSADIPFEAFSEPLRVRSAEASIDGGAITVKHMEVAAAGIEASGDYRYEPGTVRPHRFHLNLVRADASALQKLFSPALRRGSFLNYAFNFGRPPQPEWLTAMRADGIVQVAELDFGDAAAVKKLRARLLWDGYIVRLADIQSNAAGGKFAGSVIVNLSQREPQYRIPGSLTALPWRSGKVDVEGEAATYGFGTDLLTNLHTTGSFRGRGVELGAAEAWDTAAGCFEWAWAPRNSRLKLNQLVLTSAGETWLGSAETRGDGNLLLNVSDGDKKLQTAEALFSAVPTRPAP
jgi:hypothetical protein